MNLKIIALALVISCCKTYGQLLLPDDTIRWCAIGEAELSKCEDFADAVKRNGKFQLKLECVKSLSRDECLRMLDKHLADVVILDAGEVFVGGRYHSLVPIMAERYGPQGDQRFYAVALVKRTSDIFQLRDLQGKKACFTGVGQMAGWVYPISKLIEMGIIPITDCNNVVKTAADFFGDSCAPNSLLNKYNPTGDNPLKMCALCGDQGPTKCLDSSPFAGFDGALRCLTGGRGDVAFVKHTTLEELATNPGLSINPQEYELLCPNGGRASIRDVMRCNWGQSPANSLVVSSSAPRKRRRAFQDFVKQAVYLFGAPPAPLGPAGPGRPPPQISRPAPFYSQDFKLFQSPVKYSNSYNLLFQDSTSRIDDVPDEKQTFKDYLGDEEKYILELRRCPISTVKLCVVSEIEMKKCGSMKIALRAQFLKPELLCFRGKSQRDCMVSIMNRNADMTVLDAGDVYIAGKEFGLVPILAEQQNLDGPYYYAVAIAKIDDPDTDLLFVRGKFTCHTGMGFGAGWIMPVSFLLKNERLRNHGCDGAEAASEFFQKACIPGAMSPEYNFGFKQDNMCDLCHGGSGKFCKRDHSEDFFGFTGAFRCLVEGGGQIAFVKHTTIFENTNGDNTMWYARNMLSDDFQLLCRDGSRALSHDYETCNLGKVPGNAMVTRGDNMTVIDYYVNLFMYAQQYYGSKGEEDFKFRMFGSEYPYHDLIFQDATQQLVPVPEEQRNYKTYLGPEFVLAAQTIDCTAGSGTSRYGFLTAFAVTVAVYFAF